MVAGEGARVRDVLGLDADTELTELKDGIGEADTGTLNGGEAGGTGLLQFLERKDLTADDPERRAVRLYTDECLNFSRAFFCRGDRRRVARSGRSMHNVHVSS
jgi:hypothetical protein